MRTEFSYRNGAAIAPTPDRRSSLRAVAARRIGGAIYLSVHHQISYWDAAIIAAARSLGTPVLSSEDFNHGRSQTDVLVPNPFPSLLRPSPCPS